MQCEEDWIVMHALHTGHGWSISQIAREFDINWRTARRYATSEAPVCYGPRARPMELTEAQLAHVVRRLELCPDLRATTLLREVQGLGYEGSYPSFARRIRAKMAEAVSLAKLHGAEAVDRALGQASAAGRFAEEDLAAILAHGADGGLIRAGEHHSLQPGTAAWGALR